MNVRPPFIACAQTSELMQPGDGALNDPARDAQAAAVLGVATSNERIDAASSQGISMRLRVVATISLHEIGLATRTTRLASDRGNRIDQWQQLRNVVAVGFGKNDAQRNALCVAEDVVLRARFTAIGWVRSSFFPPCTARTLELSAIAREKSILSASRKRASSTWCSQSHTPASCHARKYRQQLIPEPQPISLGSISQGIPDLRTNTIPLSALRASRGLRPGCRLRRRLGFGRSGSTIDHSSSSTSGCAILPPTNKKMHGILPVNYSFC